MSDITQRADQFAKTAHGGQKRKYTSEPYICHPRAVSALVATITDDENMIAAALLHDVIEDCGITAEEILLAFNPDVAALVVELTDVSRPSDGSRSVRKALDREHIRQASARGKTIKLADLIDNTSSIVAHDPNFARVYMREKATLMPILIEGHPDLYLRALGLIDTYQRRS